MTAACRLLVNDNVERPNHFKARPAAASGRYEREHSECLCSGSVTVATGDYWRATLAVATSGDRSVLLSIERTGSVSAGAPAVDTLALVIPSGEVHAVVALVAGVVEHARQVGVLP
jgi:hypothetical protein